MTRVRSRTLCQQRVPRCRLHLSLPLLPTIVADALLCLCWYTSSSFFWYSPPSKASPGTILKADILLAPSMDGSIRNSFLVSPSLPIHCHPPSLQHLPSLLPPLMVLLTSAWYATRNQALPQFPHNHCHPPCLL